MAPAAKKAAAKKKAEPGAKPKAKSSPSKGDGTSSQKSGRASKGDGSAKAKKKSAKAADAPPKEPVDIEFWTAALTEDWKALCEAPEEVCDEKELVLLAVQGSWRAFELASDDLKNDLEVARAAVTGSWWAYDMVGEEAAEDEGLFWLAFKQCQEVIKYAGPGLRGNREFMLQVLEQKGDALEFASDELRSDHEVVGAAVVHSGEAAYKFASKDLLANDWLSVQAVKHGPESLHWTADWIKQDRDLMEVCVMNTGLALEHAADHLLGDRALVLEAVQENGRALAYASEELRDDFDLVLAAVQSRGEALAFASRELRNETDLVLEAVKVNGKALAFASDDVRATYRVALAAVEQNWEALRYVMRRGDKYGDRIFLTDEEEVEIASAAMRADWRAAEALCPGSGCPLSDPPPDEDSMKLIASANPRILQVVGMRDNRGAVLGAVSISGKSLQHASARLRADFEVVEAALRSDPDAILYASAEWKADHEMRQLSLRSRVPNGKLKKPGEERELAHKAGMKGGWFTKLPGMVSSDEEGEDGEQDHEEGIVTKPRAEANFGTASATSSRTFEQTADYDHDYDESGESSASSDWGENSE